MDNAKFVIIGAKGQLGQALQAQYPNARAVDSDELDITSREAVDGFDWSNVSAILNAAAYTNVDGAESAEGRVAAWKVNATNDGQPASWADITREIFKDGGFDLEVTDTTTEEYFASKPDVAPRPLKSTMNLDKLHATGFTSRDWHDDLANYIKKELEQ